MKGLNGKINEIADKEKELLKRKEALKKKIEKLLKDSAAEGEEIITDAGRRSAEDKETMLIERKKQADDEVRQMLINAEIEAKKSAVIFRKKSEKIMPALFKELDGYLKN